MRGTGRDAVGGAEDGNAVDAQSRVDGEDHVLFVLLVGMGSGGVGADGSLSSGTSPPMGRGLAQSECLLGAFPREHRAR